MHNNESLALYIRQPKFFKDFHCIGGSCPVSCCKKWQIEFSNEEVKKLETAKCSEELKHLIDTSFDNLNENSKLIKLNNQNECPFHNNEGLCSIQKELGEEYMSFTCTSYPRKTFLYGNHLLRSCTISCPHVMSMICSNENSMILENYSSRKKTIKNVHTYSSTSLKNNPALNYLDDLFEFFYGILSDKSRSFETSIVLGAMAAQKIDEFIIKKKYSRIPEIIQALKSQLNNPAQIAKLENFSPNLSLKANFSAGLLEKMKISNVYLTVFENGMPSEAKYNNGLEIFKEHYNGTPDFIRNIALNQYITNGMPFRNKNISLFDNYCFFVANIAIIKFSVPAVAVQFEPAYEQVEKFISSLDRCFTHNDTNLNKVLDYMKQLKITSPAYLLGIIK